MTELWPEQYGHFYCETCDNFHGVDEACVSCSACGVIHGAEEKCSFPPKRCQCGGLLVHMGMDMLDGRTIEGDVCKDCGSVSPPAPKEVS